MPDSHTVVPRERDNLAGPDTATSIPLLSVVMPVLNAELYLREAVESVLDQSFTDFELLVVDNGSTDATMDIVSQLAERDSRITSLICTEPGVAFALNAGLDASRGDWIARMDADDIAHPERFERQLSFLRQNPDTTLVSTHAWMVGPTGKVVGASEFGPRSRTEFRDMANRVDVRLLHPSVIFKRQVIIDVGKYPVDYPYSEDFALWSRLAESNYTMLTIPEKLLYYRVHDGSIGSARIRQQTESAALVRENVQRARAGLPSLTLESFRAQRNQQPYWRRIRREIRLQSRIAYRRGGGLISSGERKGYLWLLASALLWPPLPIQRLRRQVFGRAKP
ncbi:MAG: glycosyltransferase [Thermomicrobiales bacterium]|nr:glycosyltransferase [Thermomicrobiales bacterium]